MDLNVLNAWRRRKRRRATDAIDFANVIGEGAVYRGTLEGSGDYLVHGRVEGDCMLDGTLILSATGRWSGDIAAATVIIAGEVDGNVTAQTKLELQVGARIRGNIASPVIAIAAGAIYDGEIQMRRKSRVVRYQEKRESDDAA
ncbi:MAG: polymer-forming cytoskeletal protein [Gammaproteobacteria bacterium]